MKVAVIGLGLIGGSVARDLAAAGNEVIGYDRSITALNAAKRAGVIRGTLPPSLRGIETCDACVLAIPVDATERMLADKAAMLGRVALLTDVGSTKRSIVRAAERAGLGAHFVGGHPLAGDSAAGWASSRRNLFRQARIYLTPTRRTRADAVRRARRLWNLLGGSTVVMNPDEHDRLLAATSHLPQVASTGLALFFGNGGIPRARLGRGGRDVTRLAASNPEVWSAILTDNRAFVAPAIEQYRRALATVQRAVERGDASALKRLFTGCNRWAAGSREKA